jgi:cytochrome c-type protein NapC
MVAAAVIVTMALAIALAAVIFAFPAITRQRGGKILAFFPLFVLPAVAGSLGGLEHLERSKETQFCLSCHVMTEHGRSLYVDDPASLPAAHFQNHRVPAGQACFTCHTDYTMYGDLAAKLRGLRHVYVYYVGPVPQSSELKLYQTYNNRECLYCHAGARTFEEGVSHNLDPAIMTAIKSNEMSCLTSGCHDRAHDVTSMKDQKFWRSGQP